MPIQASNLCVLQRANLTSLTREKIGGYKARSVKRMYTAAGFSGRMPCAELVDSIVQCGSRTLETAISFVNAHEKWKAQVIYGDTDIMFVLLRGRSVNEALAIG